MSIEIERRFLIKNTSWENLIDKKIVIVQGYLLSNTNGWIVRIRSENNKFKLTLKKHINNSSNYEFEYEIPFREGEIIMSTLTNKVKKERFSILINNKEWIVDCFKDKNYPLIIGEIELQEVNEKIKLPNFIDKEITGIKKFTNFELSQNPFSIW